jgi:Helix-turn-helix domain
MRLTSSNHDAQAARRTELAAFLRACRARLAPADVGLPQGSATGRRRTPGLRREEVAQLSGVGVTWYTWLEQGRNISASIQVIDALARVLLLTDDQHRHLRELAGLPPPEPPVPVGDMLPGGSDWSMPRHPAPPRSMTSTSITWCGTSLTSGSGTTPAHSPPIGATCSG